MKKEIDLEGVYEQTMRLLAKRPRSEKELTRYIYRKKLPPQESEKLLARLKEQGFVNDMSFANWFVEQRLSFRPKANRFLAFELKQKGISSEIIDQVLDTKEIDDLEQARRLVAKKTSKSSKPLDPHKLTGFLSRRGFSWDIIREIVSEIRPIDD